MNSSGRQTSRSPQESSLVINIQHPLRPSRKYTNMQAEIATVRLKQTDLLLSRQREIPALCHSAHFHLAPIFFVVVVVAVILRLFFCFFFQSESCCFLNLQDKITSNNIVIAPLLTGGAIMRGGGYEGVGSDCCHERRSWRLQHLAPPPHISNSFIPMASLVSLTPPLHSRRNSRRLSALPKHTRKT